MFKVTIRYRYRQSVETDLPTWADINAYVRSLGKDGPVPLFTTMTVQQGEAKERFSIRGGGPATMKLIKLTTRISQILIEGGKTVSPRPLVLEPADPGLPSA